MFLMKTHHTHAHESSNQICSDVEKKYNNRKLRFYFYIYFPVCLSLTQKSNISVCFSPHFESFDRA